MKTILGIVLLAIGLAARAQGDPGDSLSGQVLMGVRSVEVDGAESKFREDLNLDDGARLLDLAVSFAPDESETVDIVEFSAANLGGDPFETIHFGARKYGAFDLRLDRRKSSYFYDDTILPAALASVSASTSGDHHTFDFERVRDTADLAIDVGARADISLGLEHTTRLGDSATTLDIARDEFEFDRPLDESMNSVRLGFQYRWDELTLVFDQEFRDFENTSDLFLPGASIGENTTDLSELFFFTFDQTYDYQSRGHTVRLLASPGDRSRISAAWHREDLSLDSAAYEQSSGIDFAGAAFATDFAARADVSRDIDIYTIEGGFELSTNVGVFGAASRKELDQVGASLFDLSAGLGGSRIDTSALEAGVSVAVGDRLSLSLGAQSEDRDVTHSHSFDTDFGGGFTSTGRQGYFARLEFRGDGGLTASVNLEDNGIDDPFTLSSPTDSRRAKLSARYSWQNGLGVTASVRRTELSNDGSAWTADTDEFNVRLIYSGSRLALSGGYGLVDLGRDIDQLVTGGTRQDLFAIHYAADAELIDFDGRWQASDRVALGGRLAAYENRGSYPIDRDDLKVYVEWSFSEIYLLSLSFRSVDYVEDGFDDYDADLWEAAVGLRF